MAIQPGVWGIDLGQCALKAVRLEVVDGQVVATAFDYVEHPKILSQPDADPEQLTREALEKFLSRNNLRGDTVAISVPGQSGLARFVKLPPVEEKKITDIVRFEAKQQIPFNLDEVVWDFQKIGSGIVTDGFAMETEIGLFAMKRDMVSRYLGHFKEVNVEVHLVQMAPLALCNYVSYDLLSKSVDGMAGEGEAPTPGSKKHCVVALDIGADSSNLVITDGARIIWQRPIPLGGNHFTRALTKDLKLTFAKAEHLKRNATKSPDLKKILASLKPVLNDFVGEVQRSLGYFTNTHRDAQIEYMVGLGNAFRLPGLQRFLAEKLQIDVRKLTKFERITGNEDVLNAPTFTENIATLAVPYGLALQGIKQAKLQTNLLPPEIQVERMVRAKKPMAAAAAAAMLLGIGLLTLGYAMEIRAYGSLSGDKSHPVEKAKDDAAAQKKVNDDLETKYNTLLGKVKDEETQVKALIAGKDERFDWTALQKFVSECLPRVKEDGDLNMLMTDRKNIIWTPQAKAAHEKLQARLASAKGPLGKDDIDESYQYLTQVNITGFDCRYTANLADFLTALKIDGDQQPQVLDSLRAPRAAADKTIKAPEAKPGWVIELRGYTYNKEKRFFIRDAFIENIARIGGVKDEPASGSGGAGAGAGATANTATENKDPVKGRISHVMLYRFEEVPATSPFTLAAHGDLASIAGGGGGGARAGGGSGDMGSLIKGGMGMLGGAGMGGAGMTGGMGVSGGAGASGGTGGGASASGGVGVAKDFASLISGRSGGTGGALLNPAAPAATATTTVGGGATPGKGTTTLKGAKPDADTTTQQTAADKEKPPRYEFVLLFFWQEQTPSDPLMQFKTPDPNFSSGASAAAGGGFGMGGGAGMGGMKGGMTPAK
jgi:type IV pilus assembly protein PilM